MTVKELATKCNVSVQVIYRLCKRYGRLPTEQEVKSRKIGRPRKWN